jgi:hypothetical protein
MAAVLAEWQPPDYRSIASDDPTLLNQKLPREVFKELLDAFGGVLLQQARDISAKPGPVRDFLRLAGALGRLK